MSDPSLLWTYNSGRMYGGVINNMGTLTLTGCTLSGNTVVHGEGGGIRNWGILSLAVYIVSGNTATFFGVASTTMES